MSFELAIRERSRYKPTTYADFWRIERGTLSLTSTLLSETLDLCDVTDPQQKADIVRDYMLKFTGVYALLLCLEAFPVPGDTRVVVHYGGYVSPETAKIFYDELSNLHLIKR
ncbi:hypothetical protein AAVH_32508, partial [Aphelenchoides avenae]